MRSLFAAVLMISMVTQVALGQSRVARVIPSLEIEILDPNVDSRGNPGVIVGQDAWGKLKWTLHRRSWCIGITTPGTGLFVGRIFLEDQVSLWRFIPKADRRCTCQSKCFLDLLW